MYMFIYFYLYTKIYITAAVFFIDQNEYSAKQVLSNTTVYSSTVVCIEEAKMRTIAIWQA